jgi:L-lactate dehydrogenase complex protein LldF
LLLHNRHAVAVKQEGPIMERIAWKLWKQGMLHRSWMNLANGKVKNKVVNGLASAWTAQRGSLEFPAKSFNQLWKERNKNR